MKGISTIIATILMLMITIALAGTAYLYISGAFTSQLQGVEPVDSFCSGGTVTITLKNTGTVAIPANSISCIQTSPAGDTGAPCTSTASTISLALDPGTSGSFTDICSGSGARSCIYRITPPSGRSVQAIASCT